MWNTVIPVSLNLDQGPGRKLLFDSGYDLRLSTYAAPDGTDLSESPVLRSKFQEYIGQENLELKLDKLADDPRVQNSLRAMQEDLKAGRREMDPMKSYLHNKLIKNLFDRARKRAWAKMKKNNVVQTLIEENRRRKIVEMQSLKRTSEVQNVLSIPK